MENLEQSAGDSTDMPDYFGLDAVLKWNEEHGYDEMYSGENLSQQSVGLPPQTEDLLQQSAASPERTLKRKRLAKQIRDSAQQLNTGSEQVEMTLRIVSKAFSE